MLINTNINDLHDLCNTVVLIFSHVQQQIMSHRKRWKADFDAMYNNTLFISYHNIIFYALNFFLSLIICYGKWHMHEVKPNQCSYTQFPIVMNWQNKAEPNGNKSQVVKATECPSWRRPLNASVLTPRAECVHCIFLFSSKALRQPDIIL